MKKAVSNSGLFPGKQTGHLPKKEDFLFVVAPNLQTKANIFLGKVHSGSADSPSAAEKLAKHFS